MPEHASPPGAAPPSFEPAGFGARMQFSLMADMLRERLESYRPVVDDAATGRGAAAPE